MPVILVGRTHNHVGKRLWEIIGYLKDFGVGRMVARSAHERYPEPSFYRILSARPQMDTGRPYMDEDNIKGKVLVERVFRGVNEGVVDLSKSAYKTDFKLIHKHEEHRYLEALKNCKPKEAKILPQTIELPPLLKIIAERENHECKELKLVVNNTRTYRLAEDGETPNVNITLGLQTPASPELYEGVLNKS
ncbi:small ribosomal subunit protein mS34 isoform X1 [Macrobrachium rosenbergii]|uniref:small ribosomal subunit protein mS34 isoform X1 n=2 Tax=Macrobrachium rosenbergii TaxID=79674 RepID=UPI0034D59D58